MPGAAALLAATAGARSCRKIESESSQTSVPTARLVPAPASVDFKSPNPGRSKNPPASVPTKAPNVFRP